MGLANITTTELAVFWTVGSLVAIGFGIYALFVCWRRRNDEQNDNVEFFLTARKTQPVLRVAWSFVAGGMGSWLITLPSSLAEDYGLLGLISYAFWCGAPFPILAMVGTRLQKRMPTVLGFGDYVRYRFGLIPHIYVGLIMVLNTSLLLSAEYKSINTVFQELLGVTGLPMVLLIAGVTVVYTAFGGLLVSILTDQYQAISGSTLVLVLVIYIASTFDTSKLGPFPEGLGTTDHGISSLLTIPLSLVSVTVFSEAPWQRMIASESPKALNRGALLGGIVVSIMVLIFSIFGLLASWSGFQSVSYNDHALWLLASTRGPDSVATKFIIGIVLILATIMCESAIDTTQNALANTISTILLKDKHIRWSRMAVLLINIPPIIISLADVKTLQLFMIGNKVAATSAAPLILGLYQPGQEYITGPCIMFSFIFSFGAVMIYGVASVGTVMEGIEFSLTDSYDPWSFVVAIVFSVLGVGIWCLVAFLLEKNGFKVWEISGFRPRYLETIDIEKTIDIDINPHEQVNA